jgi:luciferase family oxidoreductase group 1
VTRWVLRAGASQPEEDAVARFPEYVANILALMEPEGAGLQVRGETFGLKATPRATGVPPVWLLGSSDYSARLAAEQGLPYVFAHHFSGQGTAEALALYRRSFRPSDRLAAPRTFLTVNAVVADTQEEAERLARPQLLAMLALRTGAPLRPQLLVEEAEAVEVPEAHEGLLSAMRRRWVIGTPEDAADRIRELAATYDVDEVMVHPVAGAPEGTPADAAPGRERTLELLAKAVEAD